MMLVIGSIVFVTGFIMFSWCYGLLLVSLHLSVVTSYWWFLSVAAVFMFVAVLVAVAIIFL